VLEFGARRGALGLMSLAHRWAATWRRAASLEEPHGREAIAHLAGVDAAEGHVTETVLVLLQLISWPPGFDHVGLDAINFGRNDLARRNLGERVFAHDVDQDRRFVSGPSVDELRAHRYGMNARQPQESRPRDSFDLWSPLPIRRDSMLRSPCQPRVANKD
jgi:hypothetical protein